MRKFEAVIAVVMVATVLGVALPQVVTASRGSGVGGVPQGVNAPSDRRWLKCWHLPSLINLRRIILEGYGHTHPPKLTLLRSQLATLQEEITALQQRCGPYVRRQGIR